MKNDLMFKHAIERSLQICVEVMIDISNRIISLEGQSPATDATGAIRRLEQLNVLKDHAKYAKMIKFRNVLVHRYESIDNAVLVDICKNNLTDFEAFIKEIEQF